jgi:hypothetical protein
MAFTFYTTKDFNDPVVVNGLAMYGALIILMGLLVVFDIIGCIWRFIVEAI